MGGVDDQCSVGSEARRPGRTAALERGRHRIRPVGPFALYLLILFVLICIGGFIVSRTVPAAKKTGISIAKYTLVGAVIFGLVVALQAMTKDEDSPDVDRGFLASVVPPVASVQSAVLTVEADPADEFEAALRHALKSKDDIEKRTSARLSLKSEDSAFRQTAIEKLYLSKDPTLRRQAVLAIFAARGRDGLPVIVVDDETNDAELATDLIGKTISFYQVDTEVGALTGYLGYRFDGTVALNGISLAVGSSFAIVRLTAEDDFTLRGTYTGKSGGTVKIEVLLN